MKKSQFSEEQMHLAIPVQAEQDSGGKPNIDSGLKANLYPVFPCPRSALATARQAPFRLPMRARSLSATS